MRSLTALLCVLQGGNHIEVRQETLETPRVMPSQEEQEILNAELIFGIREGCYQLAKLEAWSTCINLLIFESKKALSARRNDVPNVEESVLARV